MAGVLPEVAVHLIGDIKDFQAKMAEAKGEMEALSSKGASSVDKLAAIGKGALLGLGAAFVAVGGLGVKFAMEEEAAQARLQQAIENTGHSWDQYKEPVEAAEASSRKLGFTDSQTADSLSKLSAATKDPTKALNDLSLAQNIARGRNIDLATATDLVVKVETGHVALLGRLGINVKDATGKTIDQATALKRLADMYGGQASTYAQTFAGKMQVLKAEGEHLVATFGTLLIPVILRVGQGLVAAAEFMERHKAVAVALGVAIASVLVPAMLTYVAVQTKAMVTSAIEFFASLGTAAVAAATKLGLLTDAEIANGRALGAMTINIGGAAAGIVGLGLLMNKSANDAHSWASKLIDPTKSISDNLDTLKQKLASYKTDEHFDPFAFFDGSGSRVDQIKALKKAIKELEDEQNKQGAAGKAAQDTMAQFTAAIDNATNPTQTLDQQVKALETSTTNLIDAEHSWDDAQQSLADAQQNLVDKQKALSDLQHKSLVDTQAVEQANRQVASSLRGVESANKSLQSSYLSLANAQKSVMAAQRALNDVMHPSARTLGEAQLGLSQATDQVKSATFGVTDAQAALVDLQKTGKASAEDLAKAELAVQEAKNSLKAATYGQADAQQKVKDLTPAGIAQSQAYRDAQDALTSAQDGVRSALDGVKTAQQGVNDANQAYLDAKDALATALKGDTNRSTELAAAVKDVASAKRAVDQANWSLQTSGFKLKEAQDEEAASLNTNADAIGAVRAQLEGYANSPGVQRAMEMMGLLTGGTTLADQIGAIIANNTATAPYNPNVIPTLGRYGGPRAGGGPVTAGNVYRVGEEGEEWYVPDRDGTILPHGTAPTVAGGGGVATIRLELDVTAHGDTPIDSTNSKALVRAIMPDLRVELLTLVQSLAPASGGAGLWGSKG